MTGTLVCFNGLCLIALAYMTRFGINSEVAAKWHELGITADRAASIGVQALAAGVVVIIIARVLGRAGAPPRG